MSKLEDVVQGAAERLLEDERLRSNLTDDEANILINWAIEWLEERVAGLSNEAATRQIAQAETARLRAGLQKINDLLAGGKTPPLPTAITSLGLPAMDTVVAALDRKETIRVLTGRLAESWRKS